MNYIEHGRMAETLSGLIGRKREVIAFSPTKKTTLDREVLQSTLQTSHTKDESERIMYDMEDDLLLGDDAFVYGGYEYE